MEDGVGDGGVFTGSSVETIEFEIVCFVRVVVSVNVGVSKLVGESR